MLQKLINDVVELDLPEEYKILRELKQSIYEDSQLLKKSEMKVLDLLNNSRGIILDDIELIESLKVSKEITKAVNDKIRVSLKKENELNMEFKQYTPVA